VTTSYTGTRVPPTLAGWPLEGIAASETLVRYREMKTVQESAGGSRQEQLLARVAGYPVRTKKREFVFRYAHVRDKYDLIEQILAAAGPFTLTVWKFEHFAFAGDGARLEFLLDHDLAADYDAVPAALVGKIDPEVKVELDGTPLTYTPVATATFDAGTPAAGLVWFETDGRRIKLPAAPAAGETVHCRFVPRFEVVEQADHEKRYASPLREPRDIVLLET